MQGKTRMQGRGHAMRTKAKFDGVWQHLVAVVLVTAVCTLANHTVAGEAELVAYSSAVAWDSHYVSEGRDNLDGDALAGTTVEVSLEGLRLGVWMAASPDADYREFNIGTAYMVGWRALEAYIGFTHLRFLSDEEDDNELGLGLAYNALPAGLSLGLDAYHSFEAKGMFLEAVLGGAYAPATWLTLSPSAVLGWNAGYIADGHDGANHIALSMEASVPLKAGLEMAATIAHTWALDADAGRYPDDESLEDFAHVGLALRATL